MLWFNGATRLLALVGGGLAGVCFAWVGILWLTSMGEPGKVAQARVALIGVVVGLVIVGMAFAGPRVVSRVVIEPSGGMAVVDRVGSDCDRMLRKQVVAHRTAGTTDRIQQIVRAIQSARGDCDPAVWNPVVKKLDIPTPCFQGSGTALAVGGLPVPASFYRDDGGVDRPNRLSSRDSSNNVLVYWSHDQKERPSDGSLCWLYVASLSQWSFSGTMGTGSVAPVSPGVTP